MELGKDKKNNRIGCYGGKKARWKTNNLLSAKGDKKCVLLHPKKNKGK